VSALLAVACDGGPDGPASLRLEWSRETSDGSPVAPTEVVQTLLYVRNEGGEAAHGVSIRFDQHEAGRLPFGISVGTATHVSSRLDGDAQVWDLGDIGPGDTLIFPMTLWFDATSRTAEPLAVGLVMLGATDMSGEAVRSNVLEVTVDARQAAGR
jgi:hypothetical protein